MALLIITTVFRLILHYLEISFIPESAIVILIGCLTGFILWLATVGLDTIIPTLDIFFLVLIPPIIFEAGYHLDKVAFMHNIRLILLLAVVGTALATFITGLLLWAAADLFKESMDVAEALVYGSLISAVDPVAVLAIFEDVHVNETLNILVFGESVLNDAVSIVFYNLFLDLSNAPSFTAAVPFLGVLRFLYVSLGGMIMGVLFALAGSFITKFTAHGEIHLLETLILLIAGYASYLVSEVFLMSGIIAILFCGMLLQRYAESNIHRKVALWTKSCVACVYIYIYICLHVCMCACIYNVCVCVCACVYVDSFVCVCVCVCVYRAELL
jgi:NhaP-type Na+/H+ or K+/H+ antiporter